MVLEAPHWSLVDVDDFEKIINIAFRVRRAMLGNGKHVLSFDMPELYDWLQRFDSDNQKTSDIADFLGKSERDRKTKKEIPWLQDIIYFSEK